MKNRTLLLLALISALFFNMQVGAFAKDAQTDTGTTQVKSYTKKNGTTVQAYTRKKKGATAAAVDTTEVKAYTKKNGTKVEAYTRKKSSKSTK